MRAERSHHDSTRGLAAGGASAFYMPAHPIPNATARRSEPRDRPLAFDVEAFLDSAGVGRRIGSYPKGKVVFSQGQPSDAVMYVQKGGVKKPVLAKKAPER